MVQGPPRSDLPPRGHSRREKRHRHIARTPRFYRRCDQITEGLLYAMIVFAPWAFGATQSWAIWVMNIVGYALGTLLLGKWLIRWLTDYSPARWGDDRSRWATGLLAGLTVLLLAWSLTSAVNARATVHYAQMEFAYRDQYVPWLPHSYHAPATWFEFWRYLGLACTFWALRDWVLGKTRRERLGHKDKPEPDEPVAENETAAPDLSGRLPMRLRRLLWVLCLNGALLALEGILQRLDNTNKLLWLVEPRYNTSSESQFGPYAYRSNAAQYLNMLWPVCLGLWWALRQEARRGGSATNRVGASPDVMLLPCAVIIAAAPIFSMSRGAMLITIGTVPAVAAVFFLAVWRDRSRWAWIMPLALAGCMAALGAVAWPAIKPRLYGQRTAYPLQGVASLNEFTLRCVFRLPELPLRDVAVLCGLSGYEIAWNGTPPGVGLSLYPNGALYLGFAGPHLTSTRLGLLDRIPTNHVGQVVDIVVRREREPRLYLNATAMGSESTNQLPFLVTNAVAGAYLRLEPSSQALASPPALVSVYDQALPESEIQGLYRRVMEGQFASSRDPRLTPPLIELGYDEIHTPALLLDQMSGRREIYAVSRRMAADHPWLGSGPGTFGPLYGVYRPNASEDWAWYAHNDWLETRITFGLVGIALVLLALMVAVASAFLPAGLPLPGTSIGLVWVGMAGCLIHALYDFPFQIHSVTALFLVLACLSSIRSRK